MSTKFLGRLALATPLCLGAVALSACTITLTKHTDPGAAPARRTLLKHLGEGVILQTYEDFADKAQALDEAVAAYADKQDDDTLGAARSAFQDAMLVWERAELFQVGPAADQTSFNPGSAGLRDDIYSWNDVRPCIVDHGLITQVYESDSFADEVYAYARGLSAIERLLFDTSDKTACEANDKIATPAAWQALVDGDLGARRAAYAAACSGAVLARSQDLIRAFRADFLPELTSAGAGSKLFDQPEAALNAVTSGLFYVDFDARAEKLGGPLGRTMSCMDTQCPTELPYSKLSKDALKQNLLALREMFQGNPPRDPGGEMWGLNDLLASVGATELADSIDGAIEAALHAVDAIQPSMEEASRTSGSDMDEALDAFQSLVDLLKTEFLRKLALSQPMRAAGTF